MNLNHLSRSSSFLNSIVSQLGPAVNLTDEEAQKFLSEKIVNGFYSSDTFYAVMNLKEQRLTFTHGTESFFGMSEITFPYFVQQIPAQYRELFMTWAEAAYSAAFDEKMKKTIQPLKQEFRTIIPLRNRQGKDYWVTQIAIPLQFDANHNLISHLNVYRVGLAYEEWENWTMKGEILDKQILQQDLVSKMNQYFKDYVFAVFSPKKSQILNTYSKGLDTKEVAQQLKVSTATIYTHNKEILSRINKLFYRNFTTVKEAALYLSREGYL